MIKTDRYLKETIQEILESGSRDQNPRPKNSKGEPAHSRFITQKVFEYLQPKDRSRTLSFKKQPHLRVIIFVRPQKIVKLVRY
jgi:hypothetical protein